jgi:hypothetical protein
MQAQSKFRGREYQSFVSSWDDNHYGRFMDGQLDRALHRPYHLAEALRALWVA